MIANTGATERLYTFTDIENFRGLAIDVIYFCGGTDCVPLFITEEEIAANQIDDTDDENVQWRPVSDLIEAGWVPSQMYMWTYANSCSKVMRMLFIRKV